MNKRQWKKKYKKEHGCNPPSSKQINMWTNSISRSTNALVEGFKRAFDVIKTNIESAVKQIQTMPEEEFREKLEHLTLEQRALAIKIRNTGKVDDENVGRM